LKKHAVGIFHRSSVLSCADIN